eukprot:scaffold10036_cov75-Phaeocystis_antarctica.AAC.1
MLFAVQSLWFHFRRTGQARATACVSTVSDDAFLITRPSGPPSPRWRSNCAHRQCSRALSASLAAATTHSPRTFSPSPTRRGPTITTVPQPNPQRPNPQRQRSCSTSAEARTRQQHGHSETQSCSSSSAKTSRPG